MSVPSPLVLVENLLKQYRVGEEQITVLHDLNFTMSAGDFTAIMGASGSGKSTFLHILGCLEQPDSGVYMLDGLHVGRMSDWQLSIIRNSSIGFVFQAFNLLPEATVYENVALPFLYSSRNEEEIKQRVLQAVDKVGLGHRLNHKPAALSGGECQRVAIARAVAVEPRLILADEPTGNLDSSTGQEILALFSRLHKHGATILLVTHDNTIAEVAGRIFTMENGRLNQRL